jgi:hypothetical protein
MVDRVPPPPFWRTRYFAEIVLNKPDRNMTATEIAATLAAPARREMQSDGRIRYWRWFPARGRWLRVVTLADGETVHNAFWDRGFRP